MRYYDHKNSPVALTIIFFILMVQFCVLWIGCDSNPKIEPRKILIGYKTDLLFKESFDFGQIDWAAEGHGLVSMTPDGRFMLADSASKGGVTTWIPQHLDGNYQLEFDLYLTDTSGLCIIFLNALGIHGEDIVGTRQRAGLLRDYSQGKIRNYQIAFHSIDKEGIHHDHSKVRKNPDGMLLSNIEPDPCKEARLYQIDIIKISNRIQMYVDGHIVHDVRDKGAFGHSIYLDGRIGFWTRGHKPFSPIFIDNVKVFKLIPI